MSVFAGIGSLLANLICLSLLTHYILVPFLAAGVPYFTKSLVPILKLEVREQCIGQIYRCGLSGKVSLFRSASRLLKLGQLML